MITQEFENQEDWLIARMGKVTGSKLKGIITKRGNGVKIGVYELIAETLAIPEAGGLSPMDRGSYLEEEALQRFQEETGKVVTRTKCLWMREDEPRIALSPDGRISDTEAAEVKCLNSARHIEALVTGKVPEDYIEQALQYFIVNDDLETLYFIFFDPRMTVKHFFYQIIKRSDMEKEIILYDHKQREVLKMVDEIVESLSDF